MITNPPDGYPRIAPYLIYEDAADAMEWLSNAFGFVERMRMPSPEGKIMHAELCYEEAVLMVADVFPELGFVAPSACPGAAQSTHLYVDDIDAHHDRAVAAGAEITRPLEDMFYGDRTYSAKDCEGHFWHFAQHVKDIAPEDMELPDSVT